jgi:membrane protein
MKQTEQPLYPKLSSIYNKILQLGSAILIIIALMSMWQATDVKNNENLAEHFSYIAKQQLKQAAVGAETIMAQEYDTKAQNKKTLQFFINRLSEVEFIKQVHLYDATGLLLVSSQLPDTAEGNSKDNSKENENINSSDTDSNKAKSINELYGLAVNQKNMSEHSTPFVQEVRGTELFGYIRFTIEKSYLTHILAKADEDQQALFRLMLLLAGVVGFLLTRGLNRFSRRGFRLSKAIKLEKQKAKNAEANTVSTKVE